MLDSHSLSKARIVAAASTLALVACGSTTPAPAEPKPEVTSAPSSTPPAPLTSAPAPSSAAPKASADSPPASPPVPGFTPIPQERPGKFPGVKAVKARMFNISGACPQVVGDDGRLCAGIVQPGAELTSVQIERLILMATDDRAFSNAPPKCTTPEHAIVLFDDKDLPVGYLSIASSCSSMAARPALAKVPQHDQQYTMTAAAMGYVRSLCAKHKLAGCDKKP